jgi:hypothetical protein
MFNTSSCCFAFCTCLIHTDRPSDSWPGEVWGDLVEESRGLHTSLPTNAWWENIVLGKPTQDKSENGIAAIPYTIDTAGDISGMRVHFPRVFAASDLIVMTQVCVCVCYDLRIMLCLLCQAVEGNSMLAHCMPLLLE